MNIEDINKLAEYPQLKARVAELENKVAMLEGCSGYCGHERMLGTAQDRATKAEARVAELDAEIAKMHALWSKDTARIQELEGVCTTERDGRIHELVVRLSELRNNPSPVLQNRFVSELLEVTAPRSVCAACGGALDCALDGRLQSKCYACSRRPSEACHRCGEVGGGHCYWCTPGGLNLGVRTNEARPDDVERARQFWKRFYILSPFQNDRPHEDVTVPLVLDLIDEIRATSTGSRGT